jgi:hypothetical protein
VRLPSSVLHAITFFVLCALQLTGPLPKNIAAKTSLQEIKAEGNFVSGLYKEVLFQ